MKVLGTTVAASVLAAGASAAIVSTGDLGNNVITGSGGGFFSVTLNVVGLGAGPQFVHVKHGLWNGVADVIQTELNTVNIGSFVADSGYISPGPEWDTFAVTNLVEGNNTVTFQGDLVQDYVIGQVDIEYNAVPEPGTLAALGLGAAVLLRRRRR